MAEETEEVRLLTAPDDDPEDPWVALRIEKNPQTLSFIQDVQSAIAQIEKRMVTSPSLEPIPPVRTEKDLDFEQDNQNQTDRESIFAQKVRHLERRLSFVSTSVPSKPSTSQNHLTDNQTHQTTVDHNIKSQVVDNSPNINGEQSSKKTTSTIATIVDRFETLPESPIKQDREETSSAYIAPIVKHFEKDPPQSPLESSKQEIQSNSIAPIVDHFESASPESQLKSSEQDTAASAPIAPIVDQFEKPSPETPVQPSNEEPSTGPIAPIVDHFENSHPEEKAKNDQSITLTIDHTSSAEQVQSTLTETSVVSQIKNTLEDTKQKAVNEELEITTENVMTENSYKQETITNFQSVSFITNQDRSDEELENILTKTTLNTDIDIVPEEPETIATGERLSITDKVANTEPNENNPITNFQQSILNETENQRKESEVFLQNTSVPVEVKNSMENPSSKGPEQITESSEVINQVQTPGNIISDNLEDHNKIESATTTMSTSQNIREIDFTSSTPLENEDKSKDKASNTGGSTALGLAILSDTEVISNTEDEVSTSSLEQMVSQEMESNAPEMPQVLTLHMEDMIQIGENSKPEPTKTEDEDNNISRSELSPTTSLNGVQFGNNDIISRGIAEIAVNDDSTNMKKPAVLHRVDSARLDTSHTINTTTSESTAVTNRIDNSGSVTKGARPIESAETTVDIIKNQDTIRDSPISRLAIDNDPKDNSSKLKPSTPLQTSPDTQDIVNTIKSSTVASNESLAPFRNISSNSNFVSSYLDTSATSNTNSANEKAEIYNLSHDATTQEMATVLVNEPSLENITLTSKPINSISQTATISLDSESIPKDSMEKSIPFIQNTEESRKPEEHNEEAHESVPEAKLNNGSDRLKLSGSPEKTSTHEEIINTISIAKDVVEASHSSPLTPDSTRSVGEEIDSERRSVSTSSEASGNRSRSGRFSVGKKSNQTSPSSTPQKPSRQFRFSSSLRPRRFVSGAKPPLKDKSPSELTPRFRDRLASRLGSSPNTERNYGASAVTGNNPSPSPRAQRRLGELQFSRVPRVGELPPSSPRERPTSLSGRMPRGSTFSELTKTRSPINGAFSRTGGLTPSPITPRLHSTSGTGHATTGSSPGAQQPLRRTLTFSHGRRATTSGIPQGSTPTRQLSQSGRLHSDGPKRFGRRLEPERRSSLSITESMRSRLSGGRPRVTIPQPFHLSGADLQEKLEQQLEEQRRKAAEVERRRRVFKARPMPDFSNPTPKPKNIR